MKRRAAAIAFGLILGITILVLAEGLMRAFGPRPGYQQHDRFTSWSLRPGFRGRGPNLPDVSLSYDIRVNRDGFRGGPVERAKPAGTFRLATLGDSVTFGFGVQEADTLAAKIAALLAPAVQPKQIEWINAGVPGFSSRQGMEHLERRVLPRTPDVVTMLFGWNDGWRQHKPDGEPKPLSALDRLIMASRALSYAERKVHSLTDRLGMDRPTPKTPRVTRVSPEDFEANLVRMAGLLRQSGSTPVFITAPAAFGPGRPPDSYFRNEWMVPRSELDATWQRYVAATRRAASSAGVLLVDCARLLPEDAALFVADGYHPNALGYQMMAEHVAASLRVSGTLTR